MCGISGFLDLTRQYNNNDLQKQMQQMTDTLMHRGPDDSGLWVDEQCGIALGQRRLAIIDLSPEGHQPMLSASGRYVINFNGEIYNYRELRNELEQTKSASGITTTRTRYPFRGHSDTEVLLAAISCWGLEIAIKRAVGMFAIALWDRQERTLFLVRDRLGEKPLYYGWIGDTLVFGSEMKSLRAHPKWQAEIDRDALALYMRHNYIPAPYTIYKHISKLIPGTILKVTATSSTQSLIPVPYWSALEVVEAGTANPFPGNEQEAVVELDRLLRQSIAGQMIADVPLGAFLSGGVDSSTIVALMQAQSDHPVRTFSIGFYEEEYNEAIHAKAVAQHLGTDHTELYVTAEEARAVIPRLPTLYDEPFADSSQIPTFLVAELARRHVTVSLSGDAGDELFGGYSRYFLSQAVWSRVEWMPSAIRHSVARMLTMLSPVTWDHIFQPINPILQGVAKQQFPGKKLHRLAELLSVDTPESMYWRFVSHWDPPTAVVRHSSEPPTALTDYAQWARLSDFTARMMYLDMVTYLPGDILAKVDRASMGVSLEARVPFLDQRVVEFAWRLPLSMKIHGTQGKWLLRQVLYQYVPKHLIERPKMGFGVPIGLWLRGPLREWAENLLDERRLEQEGFFNPKLIRQYWQEHLSEIHNWEYYLWDVLMFQAWLETYH